MLIVAPVASRHRKGSSASGGKKAGLARLQEPRSAIPAVTHVDYSARVQTVTEDQNPLFHKLLQAFEEKTGCPVLINTSFNVRGEPIVCTPEDAYRCFLRTNIDCLVMGNFLLEKKEQRPLDKDVEWLREFEID